MVILKVDEHDLIDHVLRQHGVGRIERVVLPKSFIKDRVVTADT